MLDHRPVLYRSPWQDRFETPAEVCGTCSDFDEGILVPVSFCPQSWARATEYWSWLDGIGPRPEWLETADAARWTPNLVTA